MHCTSREIAERPLQNMHTRPGRPPRWRQSIRVPILPQTQASSDSQLQSPAWSHVPGMTRIARRRAATNTITGRNHANIFNSEGFSSPGDAVPPLRFSSLLSTVYAAAMMKKAMMPAHHSTARRPLLGGRRTRRFPVPMRLRASPMFARILSSIVLCAAIVGCGATGGAQSSPSSSALTELTACTLVTSADVSVAFNRQFATGTDGTGLRANDECQFIGTAGLQAGIVSVESATGDSASSFFTSGRQRLTSSAPISGVGDQALVATDGTAILAIKGTIAVFIFASISDETAAERSNGCAALAKRIFSRHG